MKRLVTDQARARHALRCASAVTTLCLMLALLPLTAEAASPPANDAFVDAQPITGSSGVLAGTLLGATHEPGEPLVNSNPGISVWYRWTAPASGEFYFTTSSAEIARPFAEVFAGTNLTALALVSRIGGGWPVVGQREYFIRVAAWVQEVGFALAWDTELAPADFFRDSVQVRGMSGTTSGWSNRHATWEHGEPSANAGGRSIWFYWVAPLSGTATFDTLDSNFDTLLAAYRRLPRYWLESPVLSITNLVYLGASDDLSPAQIQSRVTFPVDAGNEYFLAVDGSGGATGDVTFNWSFEADPTRRPDLIVRDDAMVPRIDTVSTAPNDCIVQHGCLQPGTRRLLRFGTATRNVGNADLHLAGISNLVFEYHPCHAHSHLVGFADHRLLTNGGTVAASGLKASFCLEDGSQWDTNAAPVKRYHCGRQGIQAGWEDFYWDALPCQWVDITDVPPGLYTLEIEVDPDNQLPELNESNNTARVQVTIPPAPFKHVNDGFQSARDLGAAAFVEFEGENRGATREPGEPSLGGGRSVWFRWTAPEDGPATFETFSQRPSFDTILGVYTGDTVSHLVMVATNDNARSGSLQSRVRFEAVRGTVYHLALDGVGSAEGSYRLRLWFGAPAHDDLGNPRSYDSILRYSNVNATRQPGEPNHAGNASGRSVWFLYQVDSIPPIPAPVVITTAVSDFDTVLAVYSGSTLSHLSEVAANDNFGTNRWSQVTFWEEPGRNYWIVVDGAGGDSGEIQLNIQRANSIFSGIRPGQGALEINLFGDEESRYVLEATTNLLNWSPVMTNHSLSDIGDFMFLVPHEADPPRRFFRAREIPRPGD